MGEEEVIQESEEESPAPKTTKGKKGAKAPAKKAAGKKAAKASVSEAEETEEDAEDEGDAKEAPKKKKVAKKAPKATTSAAKAKEKKPAAKDEAGPSAPKTSDMILKAIGELDEKTGSSVSAIKKYIGENWPEKAESSRFHDLL